MKKLMIAMTAMAVGFAANAAMVNWSAQNVASSALTIDGGNALTGANQYIAYFFATADSASALSTTTLDAVKAELAKGAEGDISTLAAYKALNAYNSSTSKAGFSSVNNTKPDGTSVWGSGDTVSGFAVILDATSQADAKAYMIAIGGSGTDKGKDVLTKTANATSNMIFGWTTQANNSWTAMPSGSSVPEPTSGMLLMFGLATLALRRRRA